MVYQNIGVGQLLVGSFFGWEAARQFFRVSDRYAFFANEAGLQMGAERPAWTDVKNVERVKSIHRFAPDSLRIHYLESHGAKPKIKLFRAIDFDDPGTAAFVELAKIQGKYQLSI